MGSASSKAARASSAAAKSGQKPSWSGARVPSYDPKSSPMPRTRQPWASESKDEEIQRDAKDPQLLANLSRLNPVQVHHHRPPVETQNHVKEFFESRSRAEDDAASPRTPRNRLHVSSLVALLEEHRDMTVFGAGGHAGAGDDAVEARRLAEKYGVDDELFRRLVRSVNVPSVREDGGAAVAAGSVRHVRDAESGEDVPVKEVEWRGPISPRVGL